MLVHNSTCGILIWIVLLHCTLIHTVAASFDLQAARSDEYAFLLTLHEALRMGEKSLAVHNWFRNGNGVCDFTGIRCDHDGLVTVIDLSSKALAGTIPSSWAPLARLERLLLRNNDIEGFLPSQLPATLKHFNVDRNRLQGSIPSFQLTLGTSSSTEGSQLERLILSDNLVEGVLPTSLCMLKELRALNLSRNPYLEGTLPACLASLSELQGFQVSGTRLIGPVFNEGFCGTAVSWSSGESHNGYCDRFDLCLDGYRQVTVNQGGFEQVVCFACAEPSNVLASPTCRWIDSASNPSPSIPPTVKETFLSTIKESWSPSSIPISVPSGVPSMVPSTWQASPLTNLSPSQEFSSIPTRVATETTVLALSHVPTISPHHGTAQDNGQFPTDIASNDSEPNKPVDGVQSRGSSPARSSSEHSFYDKAAFLPVFLLLCVMSFAALLLVTPSVWKRYRRKRRTRTFATLPRHSSDSYDDEYDEDSQEEIVFSKEGCFATAGLDDVLENGMGSKSVCDCGCRTLAATPFGSSSTIAEPSMAVTARPCVVQPQTLAPNPKVRFLLLACSNSTDELGVERTTSGDANDVFSLRSLFCAPVCLPAKRTPSSESDCPPWEDVSRPSIAADSSSLSSTTPALNPFTNACRTMRDIKAMAPHLPIVPHRRQAEDEIAIAEYARKYFPEKAAGPKPPVPPEVDCYPGNNVSFSWSASNDDQAPPEMKASCAAVAVPGPLAVGDDEFFSFRPPRYYKSPRANHQQSVTATRFPDYRMKEEEDYSILGIRPPSVANHHQPVTATRFPSYRVKAEEDYYILGIRPPSGENHSSDDEYEIELYDIPLKVPPDSRRTKPPTANDKMNF